MENKKRENRLVYAALILVLTVLAALVVVTGIASRRAKPNEGIDTTADDAMAGRETAEHDPGSKRPVPSVPGKNDETNRPAATQPPTTTAPTEDVVTPSETPKFSPPSDGVVSKGHSETVLVYSMTMDDYRTHTGVDIASYEGAEVKSAAAGVIGDVWEDPMWGWCVTIDHEGDAQSTYKNLSRESAELLEKGQTVLDGEVIGSVGDSALCEVADEPHLHFELKIAGKLVDPEEYIKFKTEDVFAE